MDGTTALRVLGVSPGASKQTIKKAFRRLAQSAHPDVSGNTEAFVRLKNAYDIAHSSARSDLVAVAGATPPLPATVAQLLDSPAAAQPRKTRPIRRNAPWLTSVLIDHPDTATYESLVGAVASKTNVAATSSAKRREADFAQHLAKAMASAA